MIRYIYILIFNLIFCLGMESTYLPNNAFQLATSNSGIANSKNIEINSASINNIKNSFSFSSITWYQGIKGGDISYKWGVKNHHHLNLYTLSANDIGLWYNIPNDDPVDLFDSHHMSASYTFGKKIANKINIGLSNSIIYNQLYIDESYGYNLDFGISYLYNKNLSIGFSINNLGFEKTKNSQIKYPILAGIGASININSLKTRLNTDLIYDERLSDNMVVKVSSITKLPYLSLIAGYNYSNQKKEISCGISFKYRKVEFNYGVSFHSALGNPTILSLKYHI